MLQISAAGKEDQSGATETIVDEHGVVEDENHAGEVAKRKADRRHRSTKGSLKRKPRLRKPRLIVAGEILTYSDVKGCNGSPVKTGDDTIPKTRSRSKKYIDGSQEVNGETVGSGYSKILGESNAGVSVSSLSFFYPFLFILISE